MAPDLWTWCYRQRIASDPTAGRAVVTTLLRELGARGWAEDDVFAVHLALEEALVNAIKHGNQRDPSKSVQVICRLAPDRIQIEVEDEGEGFDPGSVPDPTRDENLEVPSGRGIMLMRCYMTSLDFNDKGNRVKMEKLRTAPEPAE